MLVKTKEELIEKLSNFGYDEVNNVSGNRVNVLIKTSARVDALLDIANKFKGKYNPRGSGSSIGRTEIGKFMVYVKTKGSGGSGAGAAVTRLTESAQCVYCACVWNRKPLTQENLKSATRDTSTDEKIENILNKLDDDWIRSCTMTAEALYGKYKSKNYHFHRGDSWVQALEDHWKNLNRIDRKFSNLNKWSPADIYMTTAKGRSVDLTKTKSILELNEILFDLYKSGDVLGISLKKVGQSVRMQEKNVGSRRPTYKFKKYTTGKRGFFLSGDSYIMYEGGEIQFRRFGTTWQGEIKGQFANMGKVSGGPIAEILNTEFGTKFIPQNQLLQRSETNIRMFYNFYKQVETDVISFEEFKQHVLSRDVNWFISKILSTQLMAIVDKMGRQEKDQLVSALLNYAGSESKLSAPYLKIY